MADIDKIKEKMEDMEYVSKVLSEIETDERIIFLKLDGKPESYSRERKGRGRHFYNPKSKEMFDARKVFKSQLNVDDVNFIQKLLSDENANYRVELDINYYLPIPKSTSIKDSVKMLYRVIEPTTIPDLDNYNKFLLDTLHEVLYENDKRVTRTHESKHYSLEPRTEILATIIVLNKK